MTIRLASDLQTDSIVDGEGIRAVLWTQGCAHHCEGCHNQITWDFTGGTIVDIEEVKLAIAELKNHDGITLSGGDPMFQIESCLEIAKYCKSIGLNVWCYTGYTFEELLKLGNPHLKEFLSYIDVLVDGKFILEQRSLDLVFRGSRNQRILDMQASLEYNEPIMISKYMEKEEIHKEKKDLIYI